MYNPLKNKDILGLIWERAESEADIISLCDANPENYKKLCSNERLSQFLEKKYPGNTNYKPKDKSWRDFFLLLSLYKGKLWEEYKYTYKGGDFIKQYKLFQEYFNNGIGLLLYNAVLQYEPDVIEFALNKGASVSMLTIDALIINNLNHNFPNSLKIFKMIMDKVNPENYRFMGSILNHTLDLLVAGKGKDNLEAIKYLVEKRGVDIHEDDEQALRIASQAGNLELVKYLVERGADIHALFEGALRFAAERGHQHVVDYLLSKGADPNALEDVQDELPPMQQFVYYDE